MSTPKKSRKDRKSKASTPYQPWLIKSLADHPMEAQYYLEASKEDEDPRVLLLALKNVAEARKIHKRRRVRQSEDLIPHQGFLSQER